MSECPKLDGYAIENFGVWVEDEVVFDKQVGYWGWSHDLNPTSEAVRGRDFKFHFWAT